MMFMCDSFTSSPPWRLCPRQTVDLTPPVRFGGHCRRARCACRSSVEAYRRELPHEASIDDDRGVGRYVGRSCGLR
jgi:hypothetical protein